MICFGRPAELSIPKDQILKTKNRYCWRRLSRGIVPSRIEERLSHRRTVVRHSPSRHAVDTDRLRATLPAWTPQSPQTSSRLRNWVLNALDARATDRVLEVGCGIGTLSLHIARHVEWLTGIDACRMAIEDARINAQAAGLEHMNFRMGVAHKALIRVFNRGARFDLVVLHGMRRPFGSRAMSVIHAMRPKRIVYIGPSARSIGKTWPNYDITQSLALQASTKHREP